ncbi:MAG: hypothetical protein LBV59_05900 [Sphingobacterium sp.]|jgi:hypothetical protein|uniref:hypothetical protein n=1 Tax=Sphingobacterium sp. TaxID=341027 RepID=UPI00284DFEA5|nr:hypothetical protein [Sphingobacterium sp.]MDR3007447.1 hypothetical protein [Sphingobacterium sp.]
MNIHQLPPINNEVNFEDAIVDLFNCLDKTETYKKFGRKGNNQKGIDIFSTQKRTVIQCKKKDLSRASSLLKNELKKDIENDVAKIITENPGLDFNTLIFVSTYKDEPSLDEACNEIKQKSGIPFSINYWGWDTLTQKFLQYPELLKRYWANFSYEVQSMEQQFKRNLDLKKNIERDFARWLNYAPENRDRNSKFIIRAFDGNQYPHSNGPDEHGEYSWFGAEIKSLFYDGLEFITAIKDLYVDKEGRWTLTEIPNSKRIRTAQVSCILFSDIVDYDINGDEYYNCPHIYCKFFHKGSPFNSRYYYELDKPYNIFK